MHHSLQHMSQREVGDVDVIRGGGSLRLLDERGREGRRDGVMG